MSRFPPVSQDEADNSKPKWNSRRSVKSTLPKNQEQINVATKTVESKTVASKSVESNFVESKQAECEKLESQKIEPKLIDSKESEDKENRNHKPATIEELSSAIRQEPYKHVTLEGA